jgi:hypothetical protein
MFVMQEEMARMQYKKARMQYNEALQQLQIRHQRLSIANGVLKFAQQEATHVQNYYYQHGLALYFDAALIKWRCEFMNTQFYKATALDITSSPDQLESEHRHHLSPIVPNVSAFPDRQEMNECDGISGSHE